MPKKQKQKTAPPVYTVVLRVKDTHHQDNDPLTQEYLNDVDWDAVLNDYLNRIVDVELVHIFINNTKEI